MSISFIRVDDRMIHGQTCTRWALEYPCDGLIAVNDKAATTPVLKAAYKNASDKKTFVWTLDEWRAKCGKVLASKDRYFLITKDPITMKSILVDDGFDPGEVKTVIIGPCNDRPGATKLGNNQAITQPEADALGVTLLPLRTNFGGEVFLDGVTMTHDEFFEKLTQAKTLPTTSQIPPFDFEEAFRRLHAEGSDILVITLSSKLSGTYQSAVIAAQETGIDVTIVDSENVTAGERVLADLAIRLRDKGFGAKEIAAKLEEAKKHLCIIGRVDTLEYLYRGGRLSKTSAIAGTLLNIKPVLTVRDGQLAVLGKARGARQSNNFLNEAIATRGGIDFSQPLMLGYSGTSDSALQEYIAASREIWEGKLESLPITSIGSTIGTHVGPGAIVVAFFANEQ